LKAHRKAMVRLLVLEKRALKWYGDVTRQYMGRVAKRFQDAARNIESQHLVSFIEAEANSLETALFSMPSMPGGPPDLFLESYARKKDCDLENDGLEEVLGTTNVVTAATTAPAASSSSSSTSALVGVIDLTL
jgi:hypothetical protein